MSDDELEVNVEVSNNVEVRLEHHHDDGMVVMTETDDWLTSGPDDPRPHESPMYGWSRRVYVCPRCDARVTADISVQSETKVS